MNRLLSISLLSFLTEYFIAAILYACARYFVRVFLPLSTLCIDFRRCFNKGHALDWWKREWDAAAEARERERRTTVRAQAKNIIYDSDESKWVPWCQNEWEKNGVQNMRTVTERENSTGISYNWTWKFTWAATMRQQERKSVCACVCVCQAKGRYMAI